MIQNVGFQSHESYPGKNQEHEVNDKMALCGTLCKEGRLEEAVAILNLTDQLDTNTYACLLQGCLTTKALTAGKSVHAHMIKTGYKPNIYIWNRLVDMYVKCKSLIDGQQVFDKMPIRDVFSWTTMIAGYAKCGHLDHARQMFEKLPEPNVVSWNAMIAGYARHGLAEEALEAFIHMQQAGMKPSLTSLVSVLSACTNIAALEHGKQVHAHVLRTVFEPNVFVESALVDMYAKCWRIEDARRVFDKMCEVNLVSWNTMLSGYVKCGSIEDAHQLFENMPERNIISWTSMISGYAQNGYGEEALSLFFHMQEEGVKPDKLTFTSVLSACANLAASKQGKAVHAHIIRAGFESYMSVANALVALYAKCGCVDDAHRLFDKMGEQDVFSWTAMIAGYSHYVHREEGLRLFFQMLKAGMKPDQLTLTSVLRTFASIEALNRVLHVHAYIIKTGYDLNVLVGSALIDMYSKCGSVEYARQVFDKMPERNVVTWNAMISGYAKWGRLGNARELFNKMHDRDIFSGAGITADCRKCWSADCACQLFDKITERNTVNWNTMGIEYAKCNSIELVSQKFVKTSERNVISWTVMIAAYVQHSYGEEALKLFHQMQLTSSKPEYFIFASVLSACASLADLERGRQVHGQIIKTGYDLLVSVGNSLVTMYAKCGSIDDANQVFLKMDEQNVVSWSAMIAAYAQHGLGKEAVRLFKKMLQAGTKADHVTFISVLSACSHAGLVDEGCHYFDSMTREHCLTPSADHYACMIDLLGRGGHLNEAEHLINSMPFKSDACMWGVLLGACRIHGNTDIGKRAADRLFELEPENSATFVLLSNLYAAAGRWNDVAKVRKMMKERGVKKDPGCSWIQVKNRVHAFVTEDRSHPLVDN
eukprot:Gb_30090 [translate_table: standard]